MKVRNISPLGDVFISDPATGRYQILPAGKQAEVDDATAAGLVESGNFRVVGGDKASGDTSDGSV